MQDITKTDEVYHKPKFRKTYNFTQYLLPIFKRDIHEGYLSSKDPPDEQNKFSNKLKNIEKSIKTVEKFLSN